MTAIEVVRPRRHAAPTRPAIWVCEYESPGSSGGFDWHPDKDSLLEHYRTQRDEHLAGDMKDDLVLKFWELPKENMEPELQAALSHEGPYTDREHSLINGWVDYWIVVMGGGNARLHAAMVCINEALILDFDYA